VIDLRLEADPNGTPASLTFFDAVFHDADWMEFHARLETGGESADVALSMIRPYREDTVTFFDKLSAMPEGWSGSANWYSEDGRASIDALGRPNGLMGFRVEVRRYAHLDAALAGEFLVGVEDVRRFASSLGTFLRIPAPPPGWKSPDVSPLSRWSFVKPHSTQHP
jgi:Family of unknown function (DUF6228)